jgi:hypothetical protein
MLPILHLMAVVDDEALQHNRSRYALRDVPHTKSAKGRWQNQVGKHAGG